MATKRLIASDVENDDQPNEKRMRHTHSFASVIGEVMMARSFQCFASSFEPLLRRVVNEEVERVIHKTMRTISRSPSQRIQAPEPTCLKLVFVNNQLPTIFTYNKIVDINGEPLKVLLVEKLGEQMNPKILTQSLKLEIVVIDGDFPSNDGDYLWSVEEFNRNIIKERAGRRPLITKDVNYTMRNESCLTLGELEFTDNSSWVRSRKFKLGARVISQTSHDHGGVRILEALTHAFIVKDQRGELYKKHYPPMLGDEVWRIEKISKDGKFHKRLEQAGINTVQDFLKLSVVNPTELKRILGGKSEISDRMWESVMKHARTCNVGNKLYISNGSSYTIMLDAICNMVSINIDGQIYSASDLITFPKVQKEVIDELVKNAYENWDSLQEVESPITESFQHFQRNKEVESQPSMIPYGIVVGGVIEVQKGGDFETNNNLPMHFEDWDASRQIFL